MPATTCRKEICSLGLLLFSEPKPACGTGLNNVRLKVMQTQHIAPEAPSLREHPHIISLETRQAIADDKRIRRLQLPSLVSHFGDLFRRLPPDLSYRLSRQIQKSVVNDIDLEKFEPGTFRSRVTILLRLENVIRLSPKADSTL